MLPISATLKTKAHKNVVVWKNRTKKKHPDYNYRVYNLKLYQKITIIKINKIKIYNTEYSISN